MKSIEVKKGSATYRDAHNQLLVFRGNYKIRHNFKKHKKRLLYRLPCAFRTFFI